ncbi:MAG: hypothetical protein ACREL5_10125 [Gemmatimonadales bacterium]
MVLDLVSPWCAAVEATGSLAARRAFRARHDTLLEALRRQRAPQADAFPLGTDPAALRPLARRAADPRRHELLRDLAREVARFGSGGCDRIAIVAGHDKGDATEPLPLREGYVVLFLDQIDDDVAMTVAFARGAAAVTRWRTADGALRRQIGPHWDRWEVARDAPLREWLYAEALGFELARALRPDLATHQLLGINRSMYRRLRQGEKSLRARLAADFDQAGIGPVLRWLTPSATRSLRTTGGSALPPMAGRYLASTMLSQRVERVGLRAAIGMAS